jgi:hypothetical protein
MSRKAISIKVSERAMSLIGKEMNKRQLEGHYRKRMQIVYQSSLGVDNQDIRANLGGSLVTVRKWRLKWQVSEERILEFEQGYENRKVSGLELIREIKAVLSDAPRPGSPSRISEAEKKRLQALACEAPEKYGLPFTNWTHVELSKQAQRMGITISSSHYGNLLKKRITSP